MLGCCSELLSWPFFASMFKSIDMPFADADFSTQSSQERSGREILKKDEILQRQERPQEAWLA